jgi:hypothetical protein
VHFPDVLQFFRRPLPTRGRTVVLGTSKPFPATLCHAQCRFHIIAFLVMISTSSILMHIPHTTRAPPIRYTATRRVFNATIAATRRERDGTSQRLASPKTKPLPLNALRACTSYWTRRVTAHPLTNQVSPCTLAAAAAAICRENVVASTRAYNTPHASHAST